MSGLEHARAMLGLAEVDLKALKAMGDAEAFEDSVFGFHAQQAVEKALKAWISLRNAQYARVHDLQPLMQVLDDMGEDTTPFANLDELTAWAVRFRYNPPDPSDAALDRAATMAQVDALVAHVRTLVGQAEA